MKKEFYQENRQLKCGEDSLQTTENSYGITSQEAIKEKKEEKLEMKITDFQLKGLDVPFEDITETYTLEKRISPTNDLIYFNPMIFKHFSSSPFMEKERIIPVDMDYPYTFRIITFITLPDNYEVEELPKSLKLTMGKENSCTYTIEQKEKSIAVIHLPYHRLCSFEKNMKTYPLFLLP